MWGEFVFLLVFILISLYLRLLVQRETQQQQIKLHYHKLRSLETNILSLQSELMSITNPEYPWRRGVSKIALQFLIFNMYF